jgi:hypothetical protein
MYFTSPVWNGSKNVYKVEFIPSYDFEYNEYHDTNNSISHMPNENSSEFKDVVNNIAEKIYTEGNKWFSSPIKPTVFLKRVSHVFSVPAMPNNYGAKMVIVIFTPITLYIQSHLFEITWKARFEKYEPIESNTIEFTEDLTQPEPTRTIVIQSHPADIELVENEEIPFDSSEAEIKLSSRAIFKRRVREARLKASIATMKAEQMAEKYFRRYGIHTDLDAESELSFESEEEDSD